MPDDVRASRAAYLLTDEHLSGFARNLYVCPACNGTGRVADPTPREIARDAWTDARTLEVNILTSYPDSMLAGILSDACEAFIAFVDESDPQVMRDATKHSARAAFRAVPALRG
jgi:hypothetical protein